MSGHTKLDLTIPFHILYNRKYCTQSVAAGRNLIIRQITSIEQLAYIEYERGIIKIHIDNKQLRQVD
jgi:hypothetical protein